MTKILWTLPKSTVCEHSRQVSASVHTHRTAGDNTLAHLTVHSKVLSAIKAYDGYHPCHRVLWINPAVNFFGYHAWDLGFEPSIPMLGGEGSNHLAVKLGKNSVLKCESIKCDNRKVILMFMAVLPTGVWGKYLLLKFRLVLSFFLCLFLGFV